MLSLLRSCVAFMRVLGRFLGVVLVGCCLPLGIPPLFAMPDDLSRGCAAVNSGALDVTATVNSSGIVAGLFGSGVVAGFKEGDALTFAVEARSGSLPLRHRIRLAAIDHSAWKTMTVFMPAEHVLDPRAAGSHVEDSYVISRHAAGWSLFTAGMAEGEGEYKVTVRCAPGPSDGVLSLS